MPLGNCRRIKSSTENHSHKEESPQNLSDTLSEISKILNLSLPNNEVNEDALKLLDSKLDIILEESKMTDILFNDENGSHNRATTATTEGNLVDILL